MRSFLVVLWLGLSVPACVQGQEFKMEPGPQSPEVSLRCIKLRPGFKAEFMVAEPLVQSPIAFAWGPDGKFWVVEMGDYPLGLDGKGKPGGRIKYLEKTQPDGPYDKMTLFMDGLKFPTGVLPHGKGILVTCAPDIFYAEDTQGTGKADRKEILFTGFVEGNQQHRVNGLVWGIDNWIYGANGDSGGKIKSIKTSQIVDISGRDFRFKVETGEFEAQSGQSQYGRCRDDWGNWFGNNNSNPMFHYVLDDGYLKRNPHVLYPVARVPVSIKPGASQVFPISKPLPRFNSPDALNHFTSACSTIVYRDTLFGKEFEGNMFVSEPVHNLIHREIMKPRGVTFTSQRAADEQTSEFLASSDNWFRPTMLQTGPDGALWVADMYRYVIEHPEWIPKDWQKKLDLRAGHDRGRIYRIYPDKQKPRAIVRMDKLSIKELAAALESPSGWTRDMAQQLLIQPWIGKREIVAAAQALQALMQNSKVPQARLHALYVTDAIRRLPDESIDQLLADPQPAIRKHGIALLGSTRLPMDRLLTDSKTLDLLEKDSDEQVRQQLAYSLGQTKGKDPADGQRLARLLCAHADQPYLLAAGLSSISEKNWKAVWAGLIQQEKIPTPLIAPLLRLAKVYGERLDVAQLFVRQLNAQQDQPLSQQILHAGDLLDVMDQSGTSLIQLLGAAGDKNRGKTLQQLQKIHAGAARIVTDPRAPSSEKNLALRLLGRGLEDDRADHKILSTMLNPRIPDDVQASAIQQLDKSKDPRVVGLLLAPWRSYTPALRNQVLDALLSRSYGTRLVLEALQKNQLPANEIDAVRRQRLLHHKEESIRLASLKIFGAASNRERGKVVDDYWLQLPDKTDRERGARLYLKACASCHQLGGVGQPVGPDLASVGDQSPQGLLIAILDPNRAVEARYISYQAVTQGGLIYNGILTEETTTTITLVGPDGKKQQLLRNELEELTSTGKSMMPDGLEKDLSPQDLADLIDHLRAHQQAQKPRQFPGNEPKTVPLDPQGILHLTPKTARIYGPKIVLEPQYSNLGWWTSPLDRAVWKVEVPKAGTYSVWIEYACANESAGNVLAIRVGQARLLYRVAGTGSWDDYRLLRIGELPLEAGPQEITVQAEGTLRNALIDLKEVKLVPK